MYKVIKKDGTREDFHLSKISVAVNRAFEASNTPTHPDIVDLITLRSTAAYLPMIREGEVRAEDIGSGVEQVLSECGYGEVAECFRRFWDKKDEAGAGFSDGLYLITTPRCPNCEQVKARLGEKKIPFSVINAMDERELVMRHKIFKAPVLMQVQNGGETLYRSLEEIYGFIDEF